MVTGRLTLSFWLLIETEEVEDKAFDTLKVQIADESGNVLQTLHTFSNRAAGPAYKRVLFDLTSFLGQRVQVRLLASEDNAKRTSFFVDTLQVGSAVIVRVRAKVPKTARITFPVSPEKKAEIRAAAKLFQLTMTEYLLLLHRLTSAMMQPRCRKRAN